MQGIAISVSSLLCRSMLRFINSFVHYLTFEAGFTPSLLIFLCFVYIILYSAGWELCIYLNQVLLLFWLWVSYNFLLCKYLLSCSTYEVLEGEVAAEDLILIISNFRFWSQIGM